MIAVGLVLSAVFVPCAFISGITGQFFRQFALTIAVSTIISAFNSLTLSPALTALLLQPRDKKARAAVAAAGVSAVGGWLGWIPAALLPTVARRPLCRRGVPGSPAAVGALVGWLRRAGRSTGCCGWLFRAFNRGFDAFGTVYTWLVGRLLRVSVLVLVVYGGLLGADLLAVSSTRRRASFPSQDMGYLLVNVQLPDSASTERTRQVMRQIEKIACDTPGVKHVTGIAGQSFVLNATGSNFGSMFVILKTIRRAPRSRAVERRDRRPSCGSEFGKEIPEASVAVFAPPPVRGVGRAGGFKFMIEDRGDVGPARVARSRPRTWSRKGNEQPGLVGLFTVFRANVPQLLRRRRPRRSA